MLAAMTLAAALSLPLSVRNANFDKPPHDTLANCRAAPEPYGACRLPAALSPADAAARLAGKDVAWWREADRFVVVARRDTDQAYLCCSIRGRMDRIDGDLWALRTRVVDLDAATIDVDVWPAPPNATLGVWRGPATPPRPPVADTLQGHVYETTIASHFLDAPRNVWFYTPPGFDPAKRYPVVYMSDGAGRLQQPRIVEPAILSGRLPPLVLVGIDAGTGPVPDMRAAEYLIGAGDTMSLFLKHESFVLHEVLPYAEAHYGAASDPGLRVVTGFSGGAAWAIEMGLRHPDIFPNVIAQSLVWQRVERDAAAAPGTRFYLSAGTLEPRFYEETQRFADVARAAHHEVVLEKTVSGHSGAIWNALLLHGLAWAFAPR
jgi:enterochelin esterase-like enzyme